jgi:hypothetical protein
MGTRVGAMVLLAGFLLAACGCGGTASRKSDVPATKVSAVERQSGDFAATNPAALRAYLRTWEESWRRRGDDIWRITGDDEGVDFSATRDSSWPRWQRIYEETASAFRNHERRLAALATPPPMRPAHDAYTAAVHREATRFQEIADALAGTDPATLNRAEMALQDSQMQFDYDGAHWESAVIPACRASGVSVPEFVRRKYISNGHRSG